jgi:hypothetical protein
VSNREAAAMQKVGCGQSPMACALVGTGRRKCPPPTIARLDPVLSRFTGYDSWLLS